MSQPDGSYPRLNGAMLATGQYHDMIVSVVGKIQGNDGQNVNLACADGPTIQVSLEHADAELPSDAVVEMIGQAISPNQIAVRSIRVSKSLLMRERGMSCSLISLQYILTLSDACSRCIFTFSCLWYVNCLPIPTWKSTTRCWRYKTIPSLLTISLRWSPAVWALPWLLTN